MLTFLFLTLHVFIISRDEASSSFEKENARREFMKNKWFEEQEEMNRNPEKDVHYQNIRFDGEFIVLSLRLE